MQTVISDDVATSMLIQKQREARIVAAFTSIQKHILRETAAMNNADVSQVLERIANDIAGQYAAIESRVRK